MITLTPTFASASVNARPMPVPPPVTIATCCDKGFVFISSDRLIYLGKVCVSIVAPEAMLLAGRFSDSRPSLTRTLPKAPNRSTSSAPFAKPVLYGEINCRHFRVVVYRDYHTRSVESPRINILLRGDIKIDQTAAFQLR